MHHVGLALNKMGLPAQERRRLYQQYRKWLRAGQAIRVIVELTMQADVKAVEEEIKYLEKHAFAGHMDYGTFRKLGVPLGSGAIESAIRRVVNLRFEGGAACCGARRMRKE